MQWGKSAVVFVLGVAIAACGACQGKSTAATSERPNSPPARQKTGESRDKRVRAMRDADPTATAVAQLERGTVRVAGRKYATSFEVELAQNEAERNRGLMHRRVMDDRAGMLFFMPGDSDWAFYMRNTYIPLDMIFIDQDWRVVGVLANVPPLTEALRQAGKPCRYVLELNAHVAGKHGIKVGTVLAFDRGKKP
jgi:uncharacterized protein